MVLITW
jgi:hypothetical protein